MYPRCIARRFAIHAALLLLAACVSIFPASASPALDLEPREFAKRWTTITDRRLLNVGINTDVVQRLSIPSSFPFRFEYYYDTVQGQVRLTTDPVGQRDFSMELGNTLTFSVTSDEVDVLISAVTRSAIDADRTLICTFVWATRMGMDYSNIVGMANVDLLINTTTNDQTQIKPGEFSWTFDTTM